MADSDDTVRIENEPSDGFLLSEKAMLTIVGVLAAALVYFIGRHMYDRWYFMRLRRRERELHRRRPGPRIHSVIYNTNFPHHIVQDRGLERVVLSSLPVFLFSGENQEEPPQGCTVCLSEFEKDDVVRLLPKCNHSFHVDCIDMWFHSHSTCPLCRSWVERVAKPVPIQGIVAVDLESEFSPPPDRFEYYLEDEDVATCAGASPGVRFSRNRLMSLKRIISMNRKPSDGGSTVDGGGAAAGVGDLECGELTREPDHVHTPNG